MNFILLKRLLILSAATAIFSFKPAPSSSVSTSPLPHARQAVSKWTIDKSRSAVKFTVTHMVVSETEGSFKSFKGTMQNTKPDFSDAKIEFSIDVNSVSTENDNRDKHLKGDDFFNAQKYPQMKFVSTTFTPSGDNKYKLSGNLTIRDVTKPVTFDVVSTGAADKPAFKATTKIDRFDYNLKWDKMTEAGGLVVSKDVSIVINIELKKG